MIDLIFDKIDHFQDFIDFFDSDVICRHLTLTNIDIIDKYNFNNNINNIIKYAKEIILEHILEKFKIDLNIIDQNIYRYCSKSLLFNKKWS